jgi:hypothetical protein
MSNVSKWFALGVWAKCLPMTPLDIISFRGLTKVLSFEIS